MPVVLITARQALWKLATPMENPSAIKISAGIKMAEATLKTLRSTQDSPDLNPGRKENPKKGTKMDLASLIGSWTAHVEFMALRKNQQPTLTGIAGSLNKPAR